MTVPLNGLPSSLSEMIYEFIGKIDDPDVRFVAIIDCESQSVLVDCAAFESWLDSKSDLELDELAVRQNLASQKASQTASETGLPG